MNTSIPKPRKKPARRKLVIMLFFLFVAGCFVWYWNSAAFQERMRQKMVSQVERATGGRVEIRSFRWHLSRLELEAWDLTIHGSEPAGAVPYAHVDHVLLRLKVLSFLGGRLGLRELLMQRPVGHIMVAADGSTNQPVPHPPQSSAHPVEQLFSLGVDRVELSQGELIWNDRRIPLDLTADDAAFDVQYHLVKHRYEGRLTIGKWESTYGSFRPFSAALDASFSLDRSGITISNLKIQSAASQLQADGRLTQLNDPRLDLNYQLHLDLKQLGEISRNSGLRSGVADIHGSGKWSVSDFSALSDLTVRNFGWQDSLLSLSAVDFHSTLLLSKSTLHLSRLAGSIAGGWYSGEATVQNPLSDARASGKVQQVGTIQLDFQGLILDRLAAIFASQLPAAHPQLAGIVHGKLGSRWRGDLHDLQSRFSIILDPQPATENALPVHGEVEGDYDNSSQRLTLARAELATEMSGLEAAGTLGPSNSSLNIGLKSADLSEFEPLLGKLNLSWSPSDLHGAGSFHGVVSGKLRRPSISGQLELSDVHAAIPAEATLLGNISVHAGSSREPRRIQFDRLSAGIELSPSNGAIHNGQLQAGATVAALETSATLEDYSLADDSMFSGRGHVRNVPLGLLQILTGTHLPAHGMATVEFEASGIWGDPQAEGNATIADGDLYGMHYKSLVCALHLAHQQLDFRGVKVLFDGAQVTGAGGYNLASRAFQFQADGERFDLAHFQRPQMTHAKLSGMADFHLEGSGTLAEPRLNGRLVLRTLAVNDEVFGDLSVQATTSGSSLHLTAHAEHSPADVALEGNIQMRENWPAQMSLRFAHLDLDSFLSDYLHGHITEHSSLDGELTMHGPLLEPAHLSLKGEVSRASINVENFKLATDGPARFALENMVLSLAPLHVVGKGTDLRASGSLGLNGGNSIGLSAQGTLNLRVLQSLNPNLLADGLTSLSVEIRGTLNRPSFSGQVQVQDGSFSFLDLPAGLSRINGTLVFNENRLQIQSLTARTGAGELKLSGFMTYSNGVYFDFSAQGNEVRLRYPPGVSASANTNLRWAGTLARSLLSGDITVTKFGLTPQFDFAQYFAKSTQTPAMLPRDSVLNNIQLNVRVFSTPALEVQTSSAKLSGDLDLRIRGTAARSGLLGRVNINSGELYFAGTKYHVERGSLVFSNPVRIEPTIDLEVGTRVRDYDISLAFHGPLDHLSSNYRSDPPLPSSDIIALLALGRTEDSSLLASGQTPSVALSASNAMLSQALNATVSSRMQRVFGVSRIKVDPQAGGAENNPSARLTVEQDVSRQVTLTYLTSLTQAAQQVVQVEVRLNRNLSFIGVRDQNGVISFYVTLRQRKR